MDFKVHISVLSCCLQPQSIVLFPDEVITLNFSFVSFLFAFLPSFFLNRNMKKMEKQTKNEIGGVVEDVKNKIFFLPARKVEIFFSSYFG